MEVESAERKQEEAPDTANTTLNFAIGVVIVIAIAISCVFVFPAREGVPIGLWTAWEDPVTGVSQIVPLILAFLYLSQGLGKITNPIPYFRDAEKFQTGIPGAIVGTIYIGMELFMAPVIFMSALTGAVHPMIDVAYIFAWVDIVGYATLSLQGVLRGYAYSWKFEDLRDDGLSIPNCTCFGIYGRQKLTIWVLLQDVIVLIETWYIQNKYFLQKAALDATVA